MNNKIIFGVVFLSLVFFFTINAFKPFRTDHACRAELQKLALVNPLLDLKPNFGVVEPCKTLKLIEEEDENRSIILKNELLN